MNLDLINKFEKEFGKSLLYIKNSEFIEIFNKKKLADKYFKSFRDVTDILAFLEKNSELKEFSNILGLKLSLRKTESALDNIFSRYKEDNDFEKLKDTIISMILSEDALDSISATLCMLIASYELDLSIYYNIVQKNIDSVFKIIDILPIIEESYSIHCDIIDLLIQLEFYWNNRYDDKITVKLEEHLEKLHNFEYKVFENSEISSVDISPEVLGLLDITKLK